MTKSLGTRILFIGDIHIKRNNWKEIDILMTVIDNDLIGKNISSIVLAGDILDSHEKIDTQLLNKAYELIDKLRKIALTYVIVGNHDYINNQQFLTTNHWMNGMKEWDNVVVVDKPILTDDLFILVPYVFPGRFIEAIETTITRKEWNNAKCIFSHQEFKGCKMGSIISIDGDEWFENLPLVISGHIHERQWINKNIFYPGSAINHAYGCDSQGLFLFDFNFKEMTYDIIDLKLDKKKIITLDLSNPDKIPKLIVNPESTKISITGSKEQILLFKNSPIYPAIQKFGTKIVFKPKLLNNTLTTLNIEKPKSFRTILEELIEKENNNLITNDYKLVFEQ